MRVLLDTNVLLDSLLQRVPWHVEADAILRQAKPGILELSVVALSLANLFYIGRRIVGTMPPIQYQSGFISDSSQDEEFVRRLHEKMRGEKLRVIETHQSRSIGLSSWPSLSAWHSLPLRSFVLAEHCRLAATSRVRI